MGTELSAPDGEVKDSDGVLVDELALSIRGWSERVESFFFCSPSSTVMLISAISRENSVVVVIVEVWPEFEIFVESVSARYAIALWSVVGVAGATELSVFCCKTMLESE